MDNVVIEINGVRHRLLDDGVVLRGCPVCSLDEQCQDAEWRFCFPFLRKDKYGHFEIENK